MTKNLGKKGEDIAAAFLEKRGFRVIERNFRRRFGEIDIVARKGKEIYFIEVKTRKNHWFGSPFEAITLTKQRKLLKLGSYYLSKNDIEANCHFSAIGILVDEDHILSIKMIDDAFEAT